MGRMIARGWIGRSAVEDALSEAMRRNGYEKEEGRKAVRATLKSGLDAGLADHTPNCRSGCRTIKKFMKTMMQRKL